MAIGNISSFVVEKKYVQKKSATKIVNTHTRIPYSIHRTRRSDESERRKKHTPTPTIKTDDT